MDAQWTTDELEQIDLGDERLNHRAAVVLDALAGNSVLSIPAACGGNAETQAAYRFFDNDKVTFDKVLAPHVQKSVARIKALVDDPAAEKVVLLVQDTTEIDLTRPDSTVAGAGYLDRARRGILLHPLIAYTPGGIPLGTVHARQIIRPEEIENKPVNARKHKPIEQKESMRWLTGLRQADELAKQIPQLRFVCIGDSESDIYELICESCRREQTGGAACGGAACGGVASRTLQTDFLIRGCHDRILLDDEKHPGKQGLRQYLLTQPVLYEATVSVRGREAKVSCEDRERRSPRERRKASVAVRAATVSLCGVNRAGGKLPPVSVNVVLVREANPPAGQSPIEWILLTTLPIDTPEQVRAAVEYYCVRWNIEIFFRTLKSGCRIEHRRFEDVQRILPCMALFMIVAWRTLFTCRMGRELPDASCEVLFEEGEWKAVWTAIHQKKPPKKPPALGEIITLVATLGGYVQRPNSPPGPQTMWIGLQRLYDLTWAWHAFGPGSHDTT